MRHISPKEMIAMIEGIPVSRAVLKRPSSGFGAQVMFLAGNGEEIMISEQGTPDPVVFTGTGAATFFQELGFFSGSHDAVVLDARECYPAESGFAQGRSEVTFGDLRKGGGSFPPPPDEESGFSAPDELSQTVYTATGALEHTMPTGKAGVGEDGAFYDQEEAEASHAPRIGEKYLTTVNLLRLTAALIVLELCLIFMLPPEAATMKVVLHICVAAKTILALSFLFFERRNPEHPSLVIRRYIWLCLLVFGSSTTLAYVIGSKALAS